MPTPPGLVRNFLNGDLSMNIDLKSDDNGEPVSIELAASERADTV